MHKLVEWINSRKSIMVDPFRGEGVGLIQVSSVEMWYSTPSSYPRITNVCTGVVGSRPEKSRWFPNRKGTFVETSRRKLFSLGMDDGTQRCDPAELLYSSLILRCRLLLD